MGRTYFGDDKKIKAYYGNKKVKSMWYGSIRVYPNAGEVTYYVDNGVVYTEEIDIDQSCLTPTTFTPSKSGWTFVGWREDSTASSSVLSEKISDGNNYTLYAVFRQNVTVTKYNGSSSATTETKTRYYNNTNVANPSFTLSQNNISGWTAQGWCTSNSATASVVVSNGGSVTLSSNATYYGKYAMTITLSYNGNGATGGSTSAQTGTRYFNSGNYSNPSFTLRSNGFSRTYYNFVNWRMGSTSGTAYNAGARVTLSTNTTFYASWTAQTQSNITVTKSNVTTAINNWAGVRTLVEFGRVFVSAPSVSISGDNEQRVVLTRKTYTIVTSTHQQGGGTWNVTVTAKGTAYANNSASGIATVKGQFSASINNWAGGSRTISFGRTFKSPPTVDWWSPNPSSSALAMDWTINITNITTTSFTISWGAQTGGATHELGWIAEGPV